MDDGQKMDLMDIEDTFYDLNCAYYALCTLLRHTCDTDSGISKQTKTGVHVIQTLIYAAVERFQERVVEYKSSINE